MVLLLQNPIFRFIFLIMASFLSHLSIVLPTIFVSIFYFRNLTYFKYNGLYITFNDSTHHLFFTSESLAVLPFTLLIFYFLNREIEKSKLILNIPFTNN